MKKILVLSLLLSLVAVNAQDIWTSDLYADLNLYVGKKTERKAPSQGKIRFEVNSMVVHPVKRSVLKNSEKLDDIFEYYPGTWIDKYESVNVIVTENGKSASTYSTDNKLTAEQKKLLQTADLNADITVIIYYQARNVVTEELESRKIQRSFTVAPETLASYTGGDIAMYDYLDTHAVQMIVGDPLEIFKQAKIRFTIDDRGKTTNVRIYSSSGILSTDKFLLKAIEKMPLWKPATNMDGKATSQDYEFAIMAMEGGEGC